FIDPSMTGGTSTQESEATGGGGEVLVTVAVGGSVAVAVAVAVDEGMAVQVGGMVGTSVQVAVAAGAVRLGVGGVAVAGLGTRGSVPCATSRPSEMPSPSVSASRGLVL